MKNILQLSTLSVCVSFIATNACSMGSAARDELRGSPPKLVVTQRQPPPPTRPAPPKNEESERDSFSSGVTDRTSIASVSSQSEQLPVSVVDSSLSITQQLASLKIVSKENTAQILEKKVEPTALQMARMSLKKRPSSSYTYSYDDLHNNNTSITSSSSVEDDSASGTNITARHKLTKEPSIKTEAINQKLHDEEIRFVGGQRLVSKNLISAPVTPNDSKK
ncbi:MAG: hypothetical protein V4544_06195 [Pseudomonadota bacterium]